MPTKTSTIHTALLRLAKEKPEFFYEKMEKNESLIARARHAALNSAGPDTPPERSQSAIDAQLNSIREAHGGNTIAYQQAVRNYYAGMEDASTVIASDDNNTQVGSEQSVIVSSTEVAMAGPFDVRAFREAIDGLVNQYYHIDTSDLPDCPCTLTDLNSQNLEDPGAFRQESIIISSYFHPGSAISFRSGDQEGQQCAYDSNGNLIVDGQGAGTVDSVSPQDISRLSEVYNALISWIRHAGDDVIPSAMLPEEIYRHYRPSNTGAECVDDN